MIYSSIIKYNSTNTCFIAFITKKNPAKNAIKKVLLVVEMDLRSKTQILGTTW